MKLKRITVGNFKNLAETTLELSHVISLVSTNNYGKSNLLEATRFGFDFITSSPKARQNMMHWTRGIPLTPTLAGNDYIFAIEFDDPSLGEYRYVRYGFRFAWYNDQGTGASISDEILEMRATESVRYTAYLKRDKGLYRASKSKTGFRKLALAKDTLAIDAIAVVDNVEISDVISKIKQISYRMCNTLELDRSFHPNPIEFDFGTNSALPFDDDDIPRALSVLSKEKPRSFELFIETIHDLFPEFQSVELHSYTLKGKVQPQIKAIMVSSDEEDSIDTETEIPYKIRDELYRLIIKSDHLNQPMNMEYMSTGTKRIFWLIANAVFAGCYGTNLLGVDEIETSIHPRMIESMLEALVDILGDASLLVTSHSPYLIQYLKPDSIYVGIPNNDGVALFKRINRSKIKTLLTAARDMDLSVGEYLFELMSGDDDSAEILSAYLEDD